MAKKHAEKLGIDNEAFDYSLFGQHDGKHPLILDELEYKDLMHSLDPRDLPHRDYLPFVKFVKYVETRGDTMRFFVPNAYNGWNCLVKWKEWNTVLNDTTINATEAARLLLSSGNLALNCDCPAYIFYGAAFILTQLDAAIIPEDRFPSIRNPLLKGCACKHLRKTIPVLAWHAMDIASAIKEQRKYL